MLKTLKNALGWGKANPSQNGAAEKNQAAGHLSADNPARRSLPKGAFLGAVSQWASTEGFGFAEQGKSYALNGKVKGRPWKLEQGKPSRDFIRGIELRARGEMNVNEDVAVMIMSRALKNELDKRAFSLYTDTLQTQVDPHLPEEMRWLSLYEEVGWQELGSEFLDQYAVLADEKAHAVSWLQPELVKALMAWPSKEPGVPRVLMVLRGKVYLRMQVNEGDLATLEHAAHVFITACQTSLNAFYTDLSL